MNTEGHSALKWYITRLNLTHEQSRTE
jgi:hypothetical protein